VVLSIKANTTSFIFFFIGCCLPLSLSLSPHTLSLPLPVCVCVSALRASPSHPLLSFPQRRVSNSARLPSAVRWMAWHWHGILFVLHTPITHTFYRSIVSLLAPLSPTDNENERANRTSFRRERGAKWIGVARANQVHPALVFFLKAKFDSSPLPPPPPPRHSNPTARYHSVTQPPSSIVHSLCAQLCVRLARC
jgi:hypothetical protein